MPVEPLPDDIVGRLRSDPTAALAAAVIVAGAFPGIVSWAARAFCGSSNAVRPGGAGGSGDRSNDEGGGGTGRSNDEGGGGTGGSDGASGKHGDASPGVRPAQHRVLALLRANPGATVARLAELSS